MSRVRPVVFCITFFFLYPFHPTGLYLYLLKKSENLWFSNFFRGYRKRPMAWNGLVGIHSSHFTQSWIATTRQSLAVRGKLIVIEYLTEKLCNLLNYATLEWWIVRLRVELSEAVTWRCSIKKVFLKNSQNSQENKLVRVSFFSKVDKEETSSDTGAFLWILRNF